VQIAVISDLHLGAGDASDAFGHDDGQFLRFLGFLESNFERIVLLGDVWETLTSPVPGEAVRALAEARDAHPEIAARFRTARYTYVHGNHDLVAAAVDRAPEELLLGAEGVRVLFAHGHLHDLGIRKARALSELGVWLGGWIRRWGWRRLYRFFHDLDCRRDGSSEEAAGSFQRWAMHLARERAADVVVTGHTHRAARTEHGPRLFLNSGSCSEGRYSFLSLDTRSGSYATHAAW
jgi:predicted phosphodiesterase